MVADGFYFKRSYFVCFRGFREVLGEAQLTNVQHLQSNGHAYAAIRGDGSASLAENCVVSIALAWFLHGYYCGACEQYKCKTGGFVAFDGLCCTLSPEHYIPYALNTELPLTLNLKHYTKRIAGATHQLPGH